MCPKSAELPVKSGDAGSPVGMLYGPAVAEPAWVEVRQFPLHQIRISGYTPCCLYSRGLFPLTPALSPREREIVGGAGNSSPFSEHPQSARKLFPLLRGEG